MSSKMEFLRGLVRLIGRPEPKVRPIANSNTFYFKNYVQGEPNNPQVPHHLSPQPLAQLSNTR